MHYLQAMLSAVPEGDGNCDRRGTAADLVAISSQLGAPADPACPSADVDGDGSITAADLQRAASAIFAHRPIYAGGPFSGRQPFGDFATGTATTQFPGNSFASSLPLNRMQRLSWEVRLNGAESVAEVAANPLATSLAIVDLRRKYSEGLAAIESTSQQQFQKSFVALSADEQDQVLAASDAAFYELVTQQTVEGMLCAPEYGGNRNLIGWQLTGFDGDSQPLGYTLGFDEGAGAYIERSDKPNSRPNPDETCAGFSANVIRFLTVVSTNTITAPGGRFRSPFCFDVGGAK